MNIRAATLFVVRFSASLSNAHTKPTFILYEHILRTVQLKNHYGFCLGVKMKEWNLPNVLPSLIKQISSLVHGVQEEKKGKKADQQDHSLLQERITAIKPFYISYQHALSLFFHFCFLLCASL